MFDYIHSFEKYNSGDSGEKSGGSKLLQDNTSTGLPLQQSGPNKLTPGETRETAASPDIPRPLYNSRIVINYVEYLKKYHPHVDIDFVLKFAGMTRHEVDDPGHWFNQQQTDKFHDILVARTVREVLDGG